MKRPFFIMPILVSAMLLSGCAGWVFTRPTEEDERQAGIDATNAAAIQTAADAAITAAQINSVPPPPLPPIQAQ